MTLTRNFIMALMMSFSATVAADVLLIEQVREAGMMDVPSNGMTMNEVESRYGQPNTRGPAVGNPPITRWVYDRWSVFFEYDVVLYTVLDEGEVLGDEAEAEDSDSTDG